MDYYCCENSWLDLFSVRLSPYSLVSVLTVKESHPPPLSYSSQTTHSRLLISPTSARSLLVTALRRVLLDGNSHKVEQ